MRMDDEPVLETLLAWYLAAGADEAVVERPYDRFAEEARRRQAPPPAPVARAAPVAVQPNAAPTPRPLAPPPLLGPDSPAAAIAAAREAAAAASTLDALRQAVAQFEGCALRRTATST